MGLGVFYDLISPCFLVSDFLTDDMQMLAYLDGMQIPYFVVATKADKPNKTDRAKMLEKMRSMRYLESCPIIPFSSLSGEGKNEVTDMIIKYLDN